jgi:hypothetical protein
MPGVIAQNWRNADCMTKKQKTREQIKDLLMNQCAAEALPIIDVSVHSSAECDRAATPYAPRRNLAEVDGQFGAIVEDLRTKFALKPESQK